MNPIQELRNVATRRTFLGATAGAALGSTALSALLGPRQLAFASSATAGLPSSAASPTGGLSSLPHFAPKAKRVLCLFQSEGFSHVDLFDNKPPLQEHQGKDLPPSIKGTQRVTGMTSGQAHFPVIAPMWSGRRCGGHGTWISDLLPHIQT
ncbi:MAG TPA: DUF1501 domain-containing protein, partial [Lacipirellulaceae bacterium]|nr:DUF1501 domain-containing protein [Lacipirellulaceae bacterium]